MGHSGAGEIGRVRNDLDVTAEEFPDVLTSERGSKTETARCGAQGPRFWR